MAQLPAVRKNQGNQLASRRREHPLECLQRDFDLLFNQFGGGLLAPLGQEFETLRVWDFDVTEDDQEVAVRAEIPGFEANELDVQFNNNQLIIKAEKQRKEEVKEEYRSFYRAISLPPGVDFEKVRATYRNGVLELHIQKSAGAQTKHIKVEDQSSSEQGQAAEKGKPGSHTGNGGKQATKQRESTATGKS